MLQTTLLTSRESGAVLHVAFDWVVGTTFTARLKGTLNQETCAVVMDGTVTEGKLTGARVHEQGQLTDATRGCFEGTIKVVSCSRDREASVVRPAGRR